MQSAEHDLTCLRLNPLTFRDLVTFVGQLQRTLLDIHAMLKFIEILNPLLDSPPSKPPRANPLWMGCFTTDTKVCEAMYFAGVPVWLLHHKEYIPPMMNIIKPVRLTFPDHIVRAVYTENGRAAPFPSIFRGPGGNLRHAHTRRYYEGTFADTPKPVAGPSTSDSSLSNKSSSGGKQSSTKQSRTAREKATMGPSKGVYFGAFLPSFLTTVVSRSKPLAGGDKKWEEPDLLEIPQVHGLFDLAWRSADKDQARVKTGVVDPGFRFPKPTLLVNVLSPERKKTYLVNWLSARSVWICRIADNPPPKFPSPQMWRDFLNTIEGNLVSGTKSSNNKVAAHEILGEEVIESARGLSMAPTEIAWRGTQVFFFFFFADLNSYSCVQVHVSTLSDPPLQFMRCLLWELYELNFRHELYALDRVLVPKLWTASDQASLAHQALFYSIFPGSTWSEPDLPE